MVTTRLNLQGNTNAVGTTGLSQQGGRISEELLNALRSYNDRIRVFKEMINDPIISTLLDAIKLPLLAAEFTVVASSPEASDVELALFIEKNLFGMRRQSWRSHVRDMLECLDYGFALGEIVLEKKEDGLLHIRNIFPRGQETLDHWVFDDEGGLEAFVQRDPNNNAEITIPIDKMIHSTFRGRKGNPEGLSMLRSLYWPYFFKRNFETFEAIGVERDIGGMPVVETDLETILTPEEEERIDEAIQEMRRDTLSGLRLPPGVKLAAYPGQATTYDISQIIHRKKIEIFQRGFSQFLSLGMEQVGTQALVQGDIDFFHLGLIAVQAELVEAWNAQLVPYLLESNDYDLTVIEPPKIVWADPGTTNVKALLEAYATGFGVGLFGSEDADKDYLRSKLDLPPRTNVGSESDSQSTTEETPTETETETAEVSDGNAEPSPN